MATFVLTFLEGLASFVSPCMLPLLPVFISYFVVENTAEGEEKKTGSNTAGLFFRVLFFVLGFTTVFCLLGFLAGIIGNFLSKYSRVVNVICGCIVILFGLVYIGLFNINMPAGRNVGRKSYNIFQSYVFGCVYSLSISPCVGVFLGSALAFASVSATALKGFLLLLAYSMGLGIPFIASALAIDKLKGLFLVIKKNYKNINIVCSIILIVSGFLMIFGFGTLSWNKNLRQAVNFLKSGSAEVQESEKKKQTGKYRKNLIEIRRVSMNEIKLTNENFQKKVLESDKPVLVDFWAEWCGPCRMLSPIISEIADEYGDRIKVGKVNVDEYSEIAAKYGISSIPAVFVFKNGEVTKSFVGARAKQDVISFIEEFIH